VVDDSNSSRTGTPVLLPAAGAFVAVPLAANAPSSQLAVARLGDPVRLC